MLSLRKTTTRPTRPNCRNGVSSMLRVAAPRRDPGALDTMFERLMRAGRPRPLTLRRRAER